MLYSMIIVSVLLYQLGADIRISEPTVEGNEIVFRVSVFPVNLMQNCGWRLSYYHKQKGRAGAPSCSADFQEFYPERMA